MNSQPQLDETRCQIEQESLRAANDGPLRILLPMISTSTTFIMETSYYASSISWVLVSPDEASERRIALHGRQGAMTPG